MQNLPKFSNRPNIEHKLPDGRVIWESRSCAVTAAVIAFDHTMSPNVLLIERGPASDNEIGKLCMPCGYIDYDESAHQAAVRETWEEAGVNVSGWTSGEQPWWVGHDYEAHNQNISLHFSFYKALKGEGFPETSIDHCEPNEVTKAIWIPLKEACQFELAFNHQDVLKRMGEVELRRTLCL